MPLKHRAMYFLEKAYATHCNLGGGRGALGDISLEGDTGKGPTKTPPIANYQARKRKQIQQMIETLR